MGTPASRAHRPAYPSAPRIELVEVLHGTPVADPFRPLEETDAPGTRAWTEAENALTEAVLSGVERRPAIRARLAELWDVPRAWAPWRRGDRWFQLRNDGLQDQDLLWVADAPGATGRILLDPNRLDPDGTTSLASIGASPRGTFVACALSEAGSDWLTWRVVRAGDALELPDRVGWSKFASAAWTADEAGFFYGRYPVPEEGSALEAPNRGMELRYHRLGTPEEEDRLVYARPDEPEWGFEPAVSLDGGLLVVTAWRGTDPESRVFVADLAGGVERAELRPLLAAGDARYTLIEAVGRTLYLLTDFQAPRGRVVEVDVDSGRMREVVPESDETLERAILAGGTVACILLEDAHHRLELHSRGGGPGTRVELPGIVSIVDASGRPEDTSLFVAVEGFATPRSVIEVPLAERLARPLAPAVLPWEPAAYVTEQVFVASGDGTRIPLFLTRRRDVAPTGDLPTLLYGYGGFQVPIGPTFHPEWLAWMERGGLLAVASLRGGGEYGREWYEAGRLAQKQNVFDDFAACLRWLVSSGWTRAERIGVTGRSNGGLLIGATLTQHPELLGAAVPEVGVMDMLRFHRFTVGWGWTSDYGSPDDPDAFRTLLAYSPLHNIRAGTAYPPTLVTTADHDDRVVPGHSFKFAAALQAAQTGDAPVLIRIDVDAGHGAGKPVGKRIEERADVLAFLELALGD